MTVVTVYSTLTRVGHFKWPIDLWCLQYCTSRPFINLIVFKESLYFFSTVAEKKKKLNCIRMTNPMISHSFIKIHELNRHLGISVKSN